MVTAWIVTQKLLLSSYTSPFRRFEWSIRQVIKTTSLLQVIETLETVEFQSTGNKYLFFQIYSL